MASKLSKPLEAELTRLWIKWRELTLTLDLEKAWLQDMRALIRMAQSARPKPRASILGCYPG